MTRYNYTIIYDNGDITEMKDCDMVENPFKTEYVTFNTSNPKGRMVIKMSKVRAVQETIFEK